MTNELKIIELLPEYASQTAELHICGISTGFISSLGIDFVTALYEAIAESEFGFGFVAQKDNKIIGFAVLTTNLSALYKSVILKNGLKFAFTLAWKIFSFGTIKKVFETLFYPGRVKKMNVSGAELLSIVVIEEGRSKGLATQLVEKGLEECTKRGIDKVKVLVGADNEPANKLYLKCGFELVEQIDSHGVHSNIYMAKTKKIDEKTL